MSARIRHVAIDCRDPHALSLFWAGVTGFAEDPDEPNLPGQDAAWLGDPVSGLGIILQRADAPKAGKNRVHLDLAPDDRTRDQEVDRVLALGAALVADRGTRTAAAGSCSRTPRATSSAWSAAMPSARPATWWARSSSDDRSPLSPRAAAARRRRPAGAPAA